MLLHNGDDNFQLQGLTAGPVEHNPRPAPPWIGVARAAGLSGRTGFSAARR